LLGFLDRDISSQPVIPSLLKEMKKRIQEMDYLQWLSPILAWHAARLLFRWSVARACPWLRCACMIEPLSAKDQAEVATRGFYTLQHTCLSVVGGLLCWRNGWLTGPGYEIFYTFPFPHDLRDLDGRVRFFYQVQVGVHIESACVLLHSVLRDGGKRQRMMLTHHAMTLFLVIASWFAGTHEVGCTLFFLHDASDIGVDVLKLARAWGATDLPQTVVYLFAVVSWGGLRCVYLPLHALIPGWQMFFSMCFAQDPAIHCYGSRGAGTYGLLALLGMSVLQVLHLLWFKELIVKGLRQLRGTGKATEIPDMCAPGGGVHEKHE
jgi:hypothetical protein